ncbi:MAG: urea transporter [Bacteroidales bacterium]|nr:urea transporter [Bacteroidales bacterium]
MIQKLRSAFPHFSKSVLHSYSLIFFGKNNLLALILLIITFFDLYTGLAGLTAVLVTTITAYLIGLNETNIRLGNYGFNALLVGLGLGIQFQPELPFFVVLVFAALLTLFITIALEGILRKYTIPYLTFPFLFAIWIIALATRYYEALEISERGIYTLNFMHKWGGHLFVDIYKWFNNIPLPGSLIIYFKSLGAIFFQYNLLAGMIIAIGLVLHSRISFMHSLIGYYGAYLFYLFIGANINELNYNFIGFNYILTAIAIGGFFIIPSIYSILWIILLIPIISLIITSGSIILEPWQLPVYSLAFNVVVGMFLYMMLIRTRFYEKPAITSVQLYSPEKNLYYQRNSEERFAHHKYFPFILPVMDEWSISQGYNGEITHKQEWRHALDFVITDETGSPFDSNGYSKEDYYCFNKPVIASAAATVEEVIDGIEDNAIGDMNLSNNWGNTVILKHMDNLYTKYSHLKRDSIQVKKGDNVGKGDLIAAVGNSGRSPEPHLHFQVQNTPFVGSKTIPYPISHFILNEDSNYSLQSYKVPKKDQKVSNVENQPLLTKAFHFIPGQHLHYKVTKPNNEQIDFEWEVMSNMYNQVYIYCHQTGSRAFLLNDGGIHYFTHFEGDKDTLLFYFYLAFYKVPLGFYKKLKVTDKLPINILKNSSIKVLQDFIAPFYLFINTAFELFYLKKTEDFTRNKIELESQYRHSVFGKLMGKVDFKAQLKDGAIDKLEIDKEGGVTVVKKIQT